MDSGARGNFMPLETCTRLGIQIMKEIEPKRMILEDGTETIVDKEALIRWNIRDIPSTTFKTKVMILKDSKYDAIIGGNTMADLKAVIDYSNEEIKIEGIKVAEMAIAEFISPTPEKQLKSISAASYL